MPSEFQKPDPQSIWQNQPTESFIMSAEQLRAKAQKQQRRARFKTLFSIILGLILFGFFAKGTFAAPHGDVVPRLGFGLISLWCLYFAYQSYRFTWPNPLAPDATLNTTLRSYRSELERRGDYARHIWRRTGLAFCFFGLALVVLPGVIKALSHPGLWVNFTPVFGLLALWFVAFSFIRRKDRQKLAQEISELRAFEKANES